MLSRPERPDRAGSGRTGRKGREARQLPPREAERWSRCCAREVCCREDESWAGHDESDEL